MNMIKSTSTTSTSGVMLISDCSLDAESLLLNCIVSISFCAGALGDQSRTVEAGLFDRDHDLPDLTEVELCIAPNHDSGVRLGSYRSTESFVEMVGCDGPIVDPQAAGLIDGDKDSTSLVALRVRFPRIRQIDVWSLPHLRRHHHENDQQHQHDINEWRDVDGRLHPARLTESHRPDPPFSLSAP